ncbi:MAG: diphosphomevalonate decarboxylase [Bdellovibrionota bacterium]
MNEVKVSASPNIAFIKYWGKKQTEGDENKNLALNPSLSMTLSKAQTTVILTESSEFELFIQKTIASPKDQEKIKAHIHRIETYLGHSLKPFHMDSFNNFPTGTGIASSASSFAALTVAFLSWSLGKEKVKELLHSDAQSLANLARRGSGSACRSLQGPFVEWQEKKTTVISSDWKLYDTIVIFSKKEKSVSSTQGHAYATLSPLFPQRLKEIPERLRLVKSAIQEKNIHTLGTLLETEAEQMHTIMRENPHPVEYQLPDTKLFLKNLKEISGRDIYYTLDAGPNAHVISERPIKDEIQSLLNALNLEAEIWEDEVGFGPTLY